MKILYFKTSVFIILIMRLGGRAGKKFHRDGARELLVGSLHFLGEYIERKSLLSKKHRIINSYTDSPFYLNIGGGQFVRNNWRVLDFYSDWYDYDEIFIDFDVNLEELIQWPIEDDTADLIFSAHTLEHLSNKAVQHTLREAARILKPGGAIRISVPDIELAICHYKQENIEWYTEFRPNASPDKLYTTRNGQVEYMMEEYLLSVFATHLTNARKSGTSDDHCADFKEVRSDFYSLSKQDFFEKYSNQILDEWQEENPGLHRNWFDYQRLESLLSEAGFTHIRKECSQQSKYTEFCYSDFGKRPFLSLHVEAEHHS